ncbi:MAG TPA: NAD(+)/NADH kinase [Steroidobacteraceae bacterium]|jgi:NAD+ kinase|nr:NAD(+)/NADH kinase [Steroidobacteraceae bacterium]
MALPVRTCALVGRFMDSRVAESAQALLAHLATRQVTVLVSDTAAIIHSTAPGMADAVAGAGSGLLRVAEAELARRADLMIAIGGDGTLLYAAGLVARHGVPLLGINRGRLGFLTDVMPEDMLGCVDAALEGRLKADERPLLSACLRQSGGEVSEALALNDVVLQKMATGRMLDFETRVGGRYVNTHAGDGIVVASATGSTAYALSCGGPIIEPHLDALVIAPICPHTLSDRPIVVSARELIEIELLQRPDTRAQVTCDGTILGQIVPGDRLEVKPAGERITLLHPGDHDYYRLLRSKLHWGRGNAER